jgi:hypothetical protein
MPVYHSISDHGPSVVNDDDAQTSPRRTVLSPTIHNSTSLSLPTWTLGTMTVPRIQTLHSILLLATFLQSLEAAAFFTCIFDFLFLTFDDINKIDTHLNRNRTASQPFGVALLDCDGRMMRCTNDDDSHTIDESFHKSKSTFLSAVLVLVGTFHPNARSIESSLPSWR